MTAEVACHRTFWTRFLRPKRGLRIGSTVAGGMVIIAIGMLLGRLSGLVRETTLASVFGVDRSADLAIFALTLPDLLTNLLIGGAVAAVIIPHYHALAHRHGDSDARGLLGQVMLISGLVSLLLSGALFLTSNLWVSLLAPGFSGTDRQAAIVLSRIALLALPLSALSAVVTAGLQIRGRLAAAIGGTLILNLTVIAALICGTKLGIGVQLASWAIVLGALVRLAAGGIYFLAREGRQGWFTKPPIPVISRALAVRYVQALAGMGLIIALPAIARAVASQTAGAMATVNYGLKLVDVPAGIGSAVVAYVLLPRFSRSLQSGQSAAAATLLKWSATVSLVAGVTGGLAYAWVSNPLVSLLFERGNLSAAGAQAIAGFSRTAMGLVPLMLTTSLLTAFCNAGQDTRGPCLISICGAGVMLVVSIPAFQYWGSIGVVAGLACAYTTMASLLAWRCAVAIRRHRSQVAEHASEPVVMKKAA